MRELIFACIAAVTGTLLPAATPAAEPAFSVQALNAAWANAAVGEITGGALDDKFEPFTGAQLRTRGGLWLKLSSSKQLPAVDISASRIPVVVMRAARQTMAQLYAARGDTAVPLPWATQLPGFRGTQDTVFVRVEGLNSASPAASASLPATPSAYGANIS